MDSNLFYALIWISGALVSNVLMDMMAIIAVAKVRPTIPGFINTMFKLNQMPIPHPHRQFSIYFSLIGSWVMAAIALFVITILAIKNKANNGKEESKQQ